MDARNLTLKIKCSPSGHLCARMDGGGWGHRTRSALKPPPRFTMRGVHTICGLAKKQLGAIRKHVARTPAIDARSKRSANFVSSKFIVRASREADLNLAIASVLQVGVYDAFKRKRDARPRSPRKFREGGKELCSEGLMAPLAQCRATRARGSRVPSRIAPIQTCSARSCTSPFDITESTLPKLGRRTCFVHVGFAGGAVVYMLALIHISEPTRPY